MFSIFGLYWEKLFDQGRLRRPIFTGPFYWKREMGDLSRNECHCGFMFVWLYGWMLYNDPFSQSSKDLLYNRLFWFVLCFWFILRETLWYVLLLLTCILSVYILNGFFEIKISILREYWKFSDRSDDWGLTTLYDTNQYSFRNIPLSSYPFYYTDSRTINLHTPQHTLFFFLFIFEGEP